MVGIGKQLIYDSIFESFDNKQLALVVDKKYQNNLTDYIKNSIESELQALLGKISLIIRVGSLDKPSYKAQLDKDNKLKQQAQINKFLADEPAKYLAKLLQTKFINIEIK